MKRRVRTDEFIVLVCRRPSDAATAGALAVMVAEMHACRVDRSKAGRVSERTSKNSIL